MAVAFGIPQGSDRSPFLFNIYVNDIVACFHSSSILIYARDLKIFKTVSNIPDCLSLQRNLNCLPNYCSRNYLFLNICKCFKIGFTRNNSPITFNYSLDNYYNFCNQLRRYEMYVLHSTPN